MCLQRPERASESLELELHIIVRHPMWVLGPTPGSSAKAAEVLLIIEPSLQSLIYEKF